MHIHIVLAHMCYLGWIDITGQVNSGELTLAKVDGGKDGVPVGFTFVMSVSENFSWAVVKNGKTFPSNSNLFSTMPQSIASVQDVLQVIDFLSLLVPCCGNDDKKFLPLVESRRGSFLNTLGKYVLHICACTCTI